MSPQIRENRPPRNDLRNPWSGFGTSKLPKEKKRHDATITWYDGRPVLALEPRRKGLRLYLTESDRKQAAVYHDVAIPFPLSNSKAGLFALGKVREDIHGQDKLDFLIKAIPVTDDNHSLTGLQVKIYRRPLTGEPNFGNFRGEYKDKKPRISIVDHYTLVEVLDATWDAKNPSQIDFKHTTLEDEAKQHDDEEDFDIHNLDLDEMLKEAEQEALDGVEGSDIFNE